MSVLDINENTRARYFYGWKNALIRQYFYLNEGLNVLNQFKYLVGGILAFCFLIKLTSYIWIGGIFLGSLPLLILIGYVWSRRVMRTLEWFNIEFSTHFAKYNIQMQEKHVELLMDIKKLLENEQHQYPPAS